MSRQRLNLIFSSIYAEALFVGVCFALAAALFSYLIVSLGDKSWLGMVFSAVVAAFIIATLLWRVVFARHRRASFYWGVLLGALVGLASHPLAWYLMILFFYLSGEPASSGEQTLDPVNGLWASLVYSLFSWLLVGWITALVGAAVGGILGYVAAKLRKKTVK